MSESTTETAGRAKRASYKTNVENMTLTQTVVGGRTKEFDFKTLPEPMRNLLAMHGLRQKLGDGHSAREKDVASATDRIWDSLTSGMWTTRGESVERTTMFVTAYANVTKTDIDVVRARVNEIEAGDDEGQKAKLAAFRKHPSIVAEIARLQMAAAQERLKSARAAGKEAGELGAL